MSKNTAFVLTVMIVLLFTESKGNPALGTENKEANPTVLMGSRITPRAGEWVKFHRAWSFPSFTSVTGLFSDDKSGENDLSLVNKRIDNLENMQQEIIEIIKKMAQDISALSLTVDKKNENSSNVNEGQKPLEDVTPEETKPNLTNDGYINGENSAEDFVNQKIPEKIETPVDQEISENIDISVDQRFPEKIEIPVDEKILGTNETPVDEIKPEVPKSEDEYRSTNMARSQGFRANSRQPWNNDNN